MMKVEILSVKVQITNDKKEHLDKWATTCNGKMFLEIILLPSRKIEKIYHFSTPEMKNKFLEGLSINFSNTAKVI